MRWDGSSRAQVVGCLGVVAIAFAAAAAQAGGWAYRAPYPQALTDIAAASANGNLYAIGGLADGVGHPATSVVRRYDPLFDTWLLVQSMNVARGGHAVAVAGGKIYAIGGWSGLQGNLLTSVEVYDPIADEWAERAPLPQALESPTASAIGGIVYVYDAGNLYAYDPVANAWSTRASAPTATGNAASAAAAGKLHVFGGIAYPTAFDVVQIYDPASNSWSAGAPIPAERWSAEAVAFDGLIYLIGGRYRPLNSASADTVFRYDPSANTWSSMLSLNTPRSEFGAAVLGASLFAVAGYRGAGGGNEYLLDSVERWRPVDPWVQKATPPLVRIGAGAGVLGGRLYLVGGDPGVPSLANDDVQQYDPASDTWTDCGGECATLPTGREYLASAVVDNKLYAIGGVAWTSLGQPGTLAFYALVDRYDAGIDAWTPRSSMPIVRSSLAAAVLGEKIYAVGGQEVYGGFGSTAFERYDPLADAWTSLTPLVTRRHSAAAASYFGKLFVFGGTRFDYVCDPLPCDYVAVRSNEVLVYDPAIPSWSAGAPMPAARAEHTATSFGRKLYIMGGVDAAGHEVDTVFEYDTLTDQWTNCGSECPPLPAARTGHAAAIVGTKLHMVGGYPGGSHYAAQMPIPEPGAAGSTVAAVAALIALVRRARSAARMACTGFHRPRSKRGGASDLGARTEG